MNPGQRMEMLDDKKRLLQAKNDEYKELVFNRATAEYQYNVAFATQLVAERLDGTPITIAKELSKGNREVARLKMSYEVQMGIERACLESMRDTREGLGADRSILTWLREEKGNG
jgi:hypothetical protein